MSLMGREESGRSWEQVDIYQPNFRKKMIANEHRVGIIHEHSYPTDSINGQSDHGQASGDFGESFHMKIHT